MLDDGTEVKLSVRYPTQGEISEADFIFRAKFAEAIRSADIFTSEELPKILKRKSIWTDDDDKKSTEYLQEISTHRIKLKDKKLTKVKGKELVEQINKLKSELAIHEQPKTFWYSQTANAMADEARAQFYCIKCTEYQKDRTSFFGNKQEFDECPHLQVIQDAIINTMYLINGFTEDINNILPENVWFRDNIKDDK
jgi:hypothetical protein